MSDLLIAKLKEIRTLRNAIIETKELTKARLRVMGISDGILATKINILIDEYYSQHVQQLEPKLQLLEELAKEIQAS